MPSTVEQPFNMRLMIPRTFSDPSGRSLTDDFLVCHTSGVGVATNTVYREDGQRREEHPCEDVCFHFKADESTYLYGLFDGYEGIRASNFASQQIPAELLLGELNGNIGDAQIRELLEQAFISVENGFFNSIDELLAEKAKLQMEIPEGISQYEAYQQYPATIERIQYINAEISGGTTAVVALIHNNKLYIANVGDSRALLCRENRSGHLIVEQLSVDHDLQNEDERLRLKELKLDMERILNAQKLGNHHNTRCIGNYPVKGGYKDFELLRSAISEPVIATPNICGGLKVDSSWKFLLLLSDGLYRSLEEATGSKQVNIDIAEIVREQFTIQSTLMGVAQAVVDKIVRLHHDSYVANPSKYERRDDISLLVRNFNQSLPNDIQTPSPVPPKSSRPVIPPKPQFTPKTTNTTMDATATEPTFSSGRINTSRMVVDEDGYIEPYVDFSDFYAAIKETQQYNIYGPNFENADGNVDET